MCAQDYYPQAGSVCDDGDVCTGPDGCSGGNCSGDKIDCDDKNSCTSDSCGVKGGCAYTATTVACDDGDKCTVGDVCKDKGCVAGDKKTCDDNEICTVDACDPKSGNCSFDAGPQQGNICDADGSACTQADACADGKCIAGKLQLCQDGNSCTVDSCDAKTGECAFDATAMQAKACNADDNGCTVADACKSGTCVAGAKATCEGKAGQCQSNACASKSATAFHCVMVAKADVSPCEDGDGCTLTDFCKGGKCLSGSQKTCPDPGACLIGVCDSKTGACGSVAGNEGQSCQDGSKCSEKEACNGGKCVGVKVTCGDGNHESARASGIPGLTIRNWQT